MPLTRPMSTTEVLQAILGANSAMVLQIEAEPKWFAHNDDGDGEAQAIIMIQARRYAVSLEPLP